mmetsp:Transcript_31544/g.92493  ORF Transcript_31544/g.92493 Transcript_31544/m.92493 type:complete len:353 (+) Transcript_31544:152-1210(+)
MESITKGSPPGPTGGECTTSSFSLHRAQAAVFALLVFGTVGRLSLKGWRLYSQSDWGPSPSNIHEKSEEREHAGIIEELYRVVTADRLRQMAQNHSRAYAQAVPFPHIVIDGIFPDRFLAAVASEFPGTEDAKGCYTEICFAEAKQNKKSGVTDERSMGLYTRVLFAFLKSSTWVTFLEELSGIPNIIPDPHYRGSGLHMTASGGSLDVHADFNRYQQYGLDRRVNTFVYLNDDWPESYGGHLELWGRDMNSCYQKIRPSMGRLVVFSSTDFSYHGHPQPQTSPPGRARRSMALYYFTNGRPTEECLHQQCDGNDHSTLFQKPINCTVCDEATCKRYDETEPYWVDTSWWRF